MAPRCRCLVCGSCVGVAPTVHRFDASYEWCMLYRAILFDPQSPNRPWLSGLGLFKDNQISYTTAPRNSDCEFRQTDERAPWSSESGSNVNFNPVSLVHAQIPRERAERQVEQRSPKISFRPLLDPEPSLPSLKETYGYCVHSYCWEMIESKMGSISPTLLLPLTNILKDRYTRLDVPFMSDPTSVPEVSRMIARSMKRGPLRVESFASDVTTMPLPLELQLLILDHLDHEGVNNTLIALRWSVPDSYFRRRFRANLFPELEGYSAHDFDWYELWCRSEALLADESVAWGLKSRRRMLECVTDVQEEFVAFKTALEKQQTPLEENQIDDLSQSHRRRWPGATYAGNPNVNQTWKEMLFALEDKRRMPKSMG